MEIARALQRWADAVGSEECQNRVYEAGVGVKQKMSKLCPGRRTSVVGGDKLSNSSLVVTI